MSPPRWLAFGRSAGVHLSRAKRFFNVIFDSNTIRDRATFGQPDVVSEGMKFVIVNGGIVIEDGKFTGAAPGKVLRGPGYRPKDSK